MSKKLHRLLKWAEENEVSLDNAEISLKYMSLTFWQPYETATHFRKVKKAIGTFEKVGNAPYIELKKNLYLEYTEDGEHEIDDWTIKWNGAYTCKSLGYDCGPADFKEEPVPEPPKEAVTEDSGLSKAGDGVPF